MNEWNILDTYFESHKYPFTKHHIDSFRQFLKVYIPTTIKSYNPITMIKFDESNNNEAIRVELYVGGENSDKIYLDRPTILDNEGKSILLSPQDARLRNLTYATKIYADITVKYFKDGENFKTMTFNYTLLGSIPLMLHSESCMLHNQGAKVLQALGECPLDPGGYFIIDGKEKVIVSQERNTTNRLIINKLKDDNFSHRAYINCTSDTTLVPKSINFYIIKTTDPLYDPMVKEDFRPYSGAILVSLPNIKNIKRNTSYFMPLTTFFRLLGIESDKAIVEAICGPIEDVHESYLNFLRPSLIYGASTGIFTNKQAINKVKNYVYYENEKHVKTILVNDIFPNINNSLEDKAKYLGHLVNSIMKVALGVNSESDRDSYIYKRIDISGILLAELFQKVYGNLRKFIRNQLDREYNYGPWKTSDRIEDMIRNDNIHRIVPSVYITESFMKSLKGMWGTGSGDTEQGKVQDLSRISYIGFLSHLRRVNLPLDRSIKIRSPHALHSQQWGIICPFETPDGESVGYLKNFALLAQISSGTRTEIIYKLLDDLEKKDLIKNLKTVVIKDLINSIKIFVNGSYYGVALEPDVFVATIRLYRRNGFINQFISVSWDIKNKEINIFSDHGRACRPLIIIDDMKPLTETVEHGMLKWFELLYGNKSATEKEYYKDDYVSPYSLDKYSSITSHKLLLETLRKSQSFIEYLDIDEMNTMLIAMNRDDINRFHTHFEIHPSTAFSVVTQIVPFANHNQAPRVYFHAAQSKQAICIPQTNFNKRMDTMNYVHHYPQKRIITTRGGHYNGNFQMPNGTNVIAAIMTYSGFNQEDAVLINEGSIKRGLFTITKYKTMTAAEKVINNEESIKFMNPIKLRDQGKVVSGIKHAEYDLLNEKGIIIEESYIPKGKEAIILGIVHVQNKTIEEKSGVLVEYKTKQYYRDISLKSDIAHHGTIHKVFIDEQTPGSETKIAKIQFRKVKTPELGDKVCLTPDHDVLTEKGWKNITDITLDDNVYVLKEDGSFGHENPVKLYEVLCENEELYKLTSQQVDLTVTKDHRMWIKHRNKINYELAYAKDIIGKRVSYAKSAINKNNDYQLILPAVGKQEEKVVNMEYFLEFFGYWISDGWARISKHMRPGRNTETIDYEVEIAQVKEDDRIRLIELIKLLGHSPIIDGETMIKVSNRQLTEFLLPLSVGAPNKYLPEWVWKLSTQQARYLYEGLRRGDGTVTKSGSDIYYTSSFKLANDVQRLALLAEWSGNIKTRYKAYEKETYINGRKIVNKYDCLSVNIVKTKNNPMVNHGHVSSQNGQKEELINYSGNVYCLEVPSHVFYVRKNGKPVWTGNCSAHGQKGTIGMIIPERDMPFSKEGIRPDIIINPHAIPSRMTIGHLVETVFAKLCSIEGCTGDGTPFINFDINPVYDKLETHGYEKYGNEILYNGKTGEQIRTEIFFGPVFYYRLKHMVDDKINARGMGPKTQLTRQPTQGRSANGGLRIGEMERDVLLGHGFSLFTKESMMEKSDKYKWAVCNYCGVVCNYTPNKNNISCNKCQRQDVSVIETPYAFKLLMQEIQGMNLQMRISTNEKPEDSSSESELEDIIEDTDSEIEEELEDEKEFEDEEPDEQELNPELELVGEGALNLGGEQEEQHENGLLNSESNNSLDALNQSNSQLGGTDDSLGTYQFKLTENETGLIGGLGNGNGSGSLSQIDMSPLNTTITEKDFNENSFVYQHSQDNLVGGFNTDSAAVPYIGDTSTVMKNVNESYKQFEKPLETGVSNDDGAKKIINIDDSLMHKKDPPNIGGNDGDNDENDDDEGFFM